MASSTVRALRIQKALAGKSLQGMSLKDIAAAIGESNVNAHRTLADMIDEGMVVQFEHSKYYALSTACVAIATAHSLEMRQAQERIDGMSQRVNAHAHQLLD